RLRGAWSGVLDFGHLRRVDSHWCVSSSRRYQRRGAGDSSAAVRTVSARAPRRRAPMFCRLAAGGGLARCRPPRPRWHGAPPPPGILRGGGVLYRFCRRGAERARRPEPRQQRSVSARLDSLDTRQAVGQWIIGAIGVAIAAVGLGIGLAGL